jgi:hypothetical protein
MPLKVVAADSMKRRFGKNLLRVVLGNLILRFLESIFALFCSGPTFLPEAVACLSGREPKQAVERVESVSQGNWPELHRLIVL